MFYEDLDPEKPGINIGLKNMSDFREFCFTKTIRNVSYCLKVRALTVSYCLKVGVLTDI